MKVKLVVYRSGPEKEIAKVSVDNASGTIETISGDLPDDVAHALRVLSASLRDEEQAL